MNILETLIKGEMPTQEEIENELYEICDRFHTDCVECPVYLANSYNCVGNDKPYETNRGCDCFKNGHEMYVFLKRVASS